MSHSAQREFCLKVKQRFPKMFFGVRVLDCGSLDINGNNRDLFEKSQYVGIDIGLGKNVDLVCRTHEHCAETGYYDVVISTECLEHDMYYVVSFQNMVRMLRSGGLLLFTCATIGRKEHGTRRSFPNDSPMTAIYPGWADYYRNLTEADVREVLPIEEIFSSFEFTVHTEHQDLHFWGIRK